MKNRILSAALLLLSWAAYAQPNVTGRVTADGRPLPGVLVSDGLLITETDSAGRYQLESDKASGSVFVISPSGYVAASTDGLRPQFWSNLYLPVEQEESHDFALIAEDQSEYTVIFPTDLHLTNDPKRRDLERFSDIVVPFVKKLANEANGPVYSFNLGDFTHDVFWYRFDFDETDALRLIQDLEYPGKMYTVMGNHDHDGAIVGEDVDWRSGWRQRDCWGPGAYSVNIGGDHWIFLDDIIYENKVTKGKKSKGIKGDRSYQTKLTDRQLEWIAKDLSYVADDTPVYICCHCPLLGQKNVDGCRLPKEQVIYIDSLAARFTHPFTVFSGHIHKFDISAHPQYPHLYQYGLPASSGIMWHTPVDWTLTSGEGCDAGMWTGYFSTSSAPEYRYETYSFGEKYYRVYDMNVVGRAYKASEGVKLQHKEFPDTRRDYSRKEYRNMIMVNYWAWQPGDVVELYENGRALQVENTDYEDPVNNFAYDLPCYTDPAITRGHRKNVTTMHMFCACTRSATSDVTLRILKSDGTTRFEEVIHRPIAFNPSGK